MLYYLHVAADLWLCGICQLKFSPKAIDFFFIKCNLVYFACIFLEGEITFYICLYFFAEVVTPSVTAFDEIVNGSVGKFVDLSNKIQGDVQTVVSVWGNMG